MTLAIHWQHAMRSAYWRFSVVVLLLMMIGGTCPGQQRGAVGQGHNKRWSQSEPCRMPSAATSHYALPKPLPHYEHGQLGRQMPCKAVQMHVSSTASIRLHFTGPEWALFSVNSLQTRQTHNINKDHQDRAGHLPKQELYSCFHAQQHLRAAAPPKVCHSPTNKQQRHDSS